MSYSVFSPIAIGPVNGDDTSWYYAHMGAYPLIIEVGTSFQPVFSLGMASVNRNRDGWLYLLGRLGGARIDVRVTDQATGDPLLAEVELLDFVFDTDELPRMTDPLFGRSRWLVPGSNTYTLRVRAAGYLVQTLPVSVADQPVEVPVALVADAGSLGDVEPDGDVDMHDILQFLLCRQQPVLLPPCTIFDFNGDNSLTLADYADLATVLLGPK